MLASKQLEHNISILQHQRLIKDKIQKKENSLRRKIKKKLLSNEFPDIGEHCNITIRVATGRLYNGIPKFRCNVYLTL